MINPIYFITENYSKLQQVQYNPKFNIEIPIYFDNEIWKDISDILHEVKPIYMISSYGKVYNKNTGYLIKPQVDWKGYLRVSLLQNNGVNKQYQVHRLVALAFIVNLNIEKDQVNHINTFKNSDSIYNLEWVTNAENMEHSINMGTHKVGEEHMWAKFTEEQVHKICIGLEKRMSYQDMCEKLLNIEYTDSIGCNIHLIRIGKNWRRISKLYNIEPVGRNCQRFTDSQIREICKCFESKMNNRDILKYLNIDISSYTSIEKENIFEIINRIKRRERFTRISKDYNF